MESEKIISVLDFGIIATDCKGDYPRGFRNGLRYAKSLISGEEPIFENCEEVWKPAGKLPQKQGII